MWVMNITEQLYFRAVFLNRWAAENFQWASSQVIVLNLTSKLYNLINESIANKISYNSNLFYNYFEKKCFKIINFY